MPPWLILTLFIVGAVVLVGLEASASAGSWRIFGRATKQYGAYLAGAAVLGLLAAAGALLFIR